MSSNVAWPLSSECIINHWNNYVTALGHLFHRSKQTCYRAVSPKTACTANLYDLALEQMTVECSDASSVAAQRCFEQCRAGCWKQPTQTDVVRHLCWLRMSGHVTKFSSAEQYGGRCVGDIINIFRGHDMRSVVFAGHFDLPTLLDWPLRVLLIGKF